MPGAASRQIGGDHLRQIILIERRLGRTKGFLAGRQDGIALRGKSLGVGPFFQQLGARVKPRVAEVIQGRWLYVFIR